MQVGRRIDYTKCLVAFSLLFLAACALPQQQKVMPSIQVPQLEGNTLIMSDSTALPVRSWVPSEAKHTKAVVLALHGFNDYSQAFKAFAEYAKKQGVAVYAYDQRGFGGAPNTGLWANAQNLWRDLDEAIELLSAKYPEAPLYVLGESMGGAVAITAFANEQFPSEKVNGLILSAPAVWGGDVMNPFYQLVLWGGAHLFPCVKLTGEGVEVQASDNIPMLRELGKDPLIIKETRIDAIYGLVALMGKAQERIRDIKTPVLFLYGAKDQIIPPVAIDKAIRRIHAPHTLVMYENGWHMLLRDLQAETVWRDIIAWIRKPLQPVPSGETILTYQSE